MLKVIFDEEAKIEAFYSSHEKIRDLIKPIICRATTFFKMVLTLVQEKEFEQDPDAVIHYINYTGKSVFERCIKRILTSEKPDGDSSLTQAGCNILRAYVRDIVKTAASSKVLGPQMEWLLTQIENEHVDLRVLLESAKKIPQFREGLRRGQTTEFENKLKGSLLQAVKKLTAEDSAGVSTLTSEELALLDNALRALETPGEMDAQILAAQDKLRKWATTHNAHIALRDLYEWAIGFTNAAKAAPNVIIETDKISKVRDVLLKCQSKPFSAELKTCCNFAVYYLLADVVLQARFGHGLLKTISGRERIM